MTNHYYDHGPLAPGQRKVWVPVADQFDDMQPDEYSGEWEVWKDGERHANIECPFRPGDVLLVRECIGKIPIEIDSNGVRGFRTGDIGPDEWEVSGEWATRWAIRQRFTITGVEAKDGMDMGVEAWGNQPCPTELIQRLSARDNLPDAAWYFVLGIDAQDTKVNT